MTSRRDNNKRLTLPKEFEEQKRLHHWVLDANCTPIPSRAQTRLRPNRDVYDGWVGNGRVIMLGAQMRGKGRQAAQYSESDSEHDSDSADDEWTSEDSMSSDSSSSSESEEILGEDQDGDDTLGIPSWLRTGTRVEVCQKKDQWKPGVVIEIHNHQKRISIDCRLLSGRVVRKIPLNRVRRVRGKADTSSVVSSVDTEYVRDMTLRMKALRDGRELPPELAMAANALKVRLHGKENSDNKVLVPSSNKDKDLILIPSSSAQGSRPLTRETSTQLSQFGFRHARSSGTLHRRSKDTEVRTSYGYWKGSGSPLLSVPSELRGAVSAAVSSPYVLFELKHESN